MQETSTSTMKIHWAAVRSPTAPGSVSCHQISTCTLRRHLRPWVQLLVTKNAKLSVTPSASIRRNGCSTLLIGFSLARTLTQTPSRGMRPRLSSRARRFNCMGGSAVFWPTRRRVATFFCKMLVPQHCWPSDNHSLLRTESRLNDYLASNVNQFQYCSHPLTAK